MRTKSLAFSLIFIFFITTVAAEKMELSSSQDKIILTIKENTINIAAGRIYMSISEALNLYQPQGTGFFSNIYDIKGNNSNLELQFFDFLANSPSGRLEIPFSAPPGVYTARVEKIELYNKSDFLIPFDFPLEIKITVGIPRPIPPSGSGAIGSGSGGSDISLPEVQPAQRARTSGTASKEEIQQAENKTEANAEEKTQTTPFWEIGAVSISILMLILVLYEIMHKISKNIEHKITSG